MGFVDELLDGLRKIVNRCDDSAKMRDVRRLAAGLLEKFEGEEKEAQP